MTTSNTRELLTELFGRLRYSGFQLGVGELLAALRTVEIGWGSDGPDDLKQVVRLIWCHSLEEAQTLDWIWASTLAEFERRKAPQPEIEQRPSPPPIEPPPHSIDEPPVVPNEQTAAMPALPELATMPVLAPFVPVLMHDASDLNAYWPISRRAMAYTWRYLRRPLPDGPVDVLDVAATVERAARQGFYLAPIYRRRERNHAHLVLLIDQDGSMVPFHRVTRDLVETARYDSTLDQEQIEVYYFHNTPASTIYLDQYQTIPVPLDQALGRWSTDTSVLIVSDAGAARGRRRLERIRATTEFLAQIKRRTTLLAWLNPMPQDRWPGTSAQIIAHLIPMFQMDDDGLSGAIDAARGQVQAR
jgi:uncharacterized protein with von Willebrand factor type A (vWA) domain